MSKHKKVLILKIGMNYYLCEHIARAYTNRMEQELDKKYKDRLIEWKHDD